MPRSRNVDGETVQCPPDTETERWCPLCQDYLPFSEFYSWKSGWKTRRCKKHHARKSYESRQRTPSKRAENYRRDDLRRKFNMSPEDYAAKLAEQGGMCAICGQAETCLTNGGDRVRHLSVDHDHATGQLRGLLCSNCNKGLGYFGDDPIRMVAAAEYLLRWRG